MFEVVILAGGKGTRLKSVTGDLPKPMVAIKGIPFLYILMKKMVEQGCKRIVLSLCYQAEYIEEKIRSDAPVDCDVVFVREDVPLGTGGAIKEASKLISEESFLVVNGDTFFDMDFAGFMSETTENPIVLGLAKVDNTYRYGAVEMDASGKVVSMKEKGVEGVGLINAGAYRLQTDFIRQVADEKFSFESFLEKNLPLVSARVFAGFFIDIGIPEDYYKACEALV